MADMVRRFGLGIAPADLLWWSAGVGWALFMAWLNIAGERDRSRVAGGSRLECGTHPLDMLRVGEIVEESTLRFVVDAHCANARYLSADRIELRYGGRPVAVETERLSFAGEPYHRIVSIGGWTVD